jgi:hypothetical protein
VENWLSGIQSHAIEIANAFGAQIIPASRKLNQPRLFGSASARPTIT